MEIASTDSRRAARCSVDSGSLRLRNSDACDSAEHAKNHQILLLGSPSWKNMTVCASPWLLMRQYLQGEGRRLNCGVRPLAATRSGCLPG